MYKCFRFTAYCLVLSAYCLVGCKKEEKVIARVGKASLSESAFYEMIPPQYMAQLGPAQKRELIQRWANTELLYQQALKEKIHKKKEIAMRLKSIEKELLANEFLSGYMIKHVVVPEGEIRAYFDKHEDEYNKEIRIAQILVATLEEANDILSRLKRNESFGSLARKYSLDPSAKNNGVMGYIKRGDIANLPEFEDAAYNLKKTGDMSDIVKTTYGYHIIKLIGARKTSKKVNYEDVRNKIENHLTMTKQKTVFDSLLDELRTKISVEIHNELL